MDLSGIIFVVLALAWAGYLIPKALKHQDEVARTQSIDRFSTAMRVLARRDPDETSDAQPAPPTRSAEGPQASAPSRPPVRRDAARRAAARAAARRRRRILVSLLLADVIVGTVAALGYAPVWAPAIPVALTGLYLVLCRTQVRREAVATWEREFPGTADGEVAPRRAVRSDAAHGRPAEGYGAQEDTVGIPVELLEAVVVPTVDGGSLWDPLPMTLPTYVNKPKAQRTVRTIDLNEPGAWTSGRTEEDARLVQETEEAEAQAAEAEATGVDEQQQRAVGS